LSNQTDLQNALNAKQDKRIVVSTSQNAVIDEAYTLVATATFTDPTPAEGKGFSVLIRNGTATIGGTNYSTAGTTIWRVFHSGAWANYVNQLGLGFTPENVANKSDSYTLSSSTTYASTKALVDGLAAQTANDVSVIAKATNLTMTGVTTERCLMVIPLEVGNSDWLYQITNFCRSATGTLGSTLLRVGTVASPIDGNVGANAIANQTLVATYNHGNNNRTPFKRTLNVFGGAGGSMVRAVAATSIINDETAANSQTITNLDMTVQRYVYLSYNMVDATNVYTLNGAFATKLKMN
jgi:hypothetical protein